VRDRGRIVNLGRCGRDGIGFGSRGRGSLTGLAARRLSARRRAGCAPKRSGA